MIPAFDVLTGCIASYWEDRPFDANFQQVFLFNSFAISIGRHGRRWTGNASARRDNPG